MTLIGTTGADTLLSLQKECSNLIRSGLGKSGLLILCGRYLMPNAAIVTKKHNIAMNFENYITAIVRGRGVGLIGWPESVPFKRMSKQSTIGHVRCLRDELKAGTCRWKVLSKLEQDELAEKFRGMVERGERSEKVRKVRSDKGQVHRKAVAKSGGKPSGKSRAKKRAASVGESSGSAEDEDENEDEEDRQIQIQKIAAKPAKDRSVAEKRQMLMDLSKKKLKASEGEKKSKSTAGEKKSKSSSGEKVLKRAREDKDDGGPPQKKKSLEQRKSDGSLQQKRKSTPAQDDDSNEAPPKKTRKTRADGSARNQKKLDDGGAANDRLRKQMGLDKTASTQAAGSGSQSTVPKPRAILKGKAGVPPGYRP